MFDATASTRRPSPSSAIANAPRSSSQKSRGEALPQVVGPRRAVPCRRLVAVRGRERGAGPPRRERVGLDLGGRERRLGEPAVGERDRVVRVLPRLVHERAGRRGAVRDVAVARLLVACEPPERRVDRRAGAPSRARPARPTARARARASRTMGWRRSIRSRCRRRPMRARRRGRERISWRIRPGCSSVAGTSSRPWSRASAEAVPRASSGASGSAIHDVRIESRPNSVMYQGAPAATRTSSG